MLHKGLSVATTADKNRTLRGTRRQGVARTLRGTLWQTVTQRVAGRGRHIDEFCGLLLGLAVTGVKEGGTCGDYGTDKKWVQNCGWKTWWENELAWCIWLKIETRSQIHHSSERGRLFLTRLATVSFWKTSLHIGKIFVAEHCGHVTLSRACVSRHPSACPKHVLLSCTCVRAVHLGLTAEIAACSNCSNVKKLLIRIILLLYDFYFLFYFIVCSKTNNLHCLPRYVFLELWVWEWRILGRNTSLF